MATLEFRTGILQSKITSKARGSFNTLKSQREFLDELGKRLNIKYWEEWYSVTKAEIDEKGGGIHFLLLIHRLAYLVHCFKDSPQVTLATLYPEHPWKPWKFNAVTEGFWKDKQNVFLSTTLFTITRSAISWKILVKNLTYKNGQIGTTLPTETFAIMEVLQC